MTPKNFKNFYDAWLDSRPFGQSFHQSAMYILQNAGKCLRPNLLLALASDLKLESKNNFWLALALELHHTYTLIHDDLPCMDNDDLRRGKPTVHKKYGEAHALLLGDILLSKSYAVFSELENVESKNILLLIKVFSFATSSKGLILGQELDLAGGDNHVATSKVLRLFELKTSRLFQLALVMPLLLTTSPEFKLVKRLWRLGEVCGVTFQLLDDLEDQSNDKKADFNFFRINEVEAKKQLAYYQKRFFIIKADLAHVLPNTFELLEKYLKY